MRNKSFFKGQRVIAGNSKNPFHGTIGSVDYKNKVIFGITDGGTRFSASFGVSQVDPEYIVKAKSR